MFLSRCLYPQIDAFLTVGHNSRSQYLACGVPSSKLFPFPYSVDNDHFRTRAKAAASKRAALRKEFGIPDAATCVVYAGRLAPEKNLSELIRGVADTRDQHLLLIGTGREEAALRELAVRLLPGRHHFAGFMNYDRLAEGYAAADVFALTSRFEPWGLVCNEAMASGLPIVVSDRVGAGADLVEEGKTGFVYRSGDTGALTRALVAAEDMVRGRPEQVSQALRAKLEEHSMERMVEGLLRALQVD
jgi:glycosyltransferase involved in cell wall biosynthesis